MIFTEFPDLRWLKQQAERRFSDRKAYDGTTLPHEGWPTVILNVKTQQTYRDGIRGPLSIFSNLSGASQVTIDGKPALIKDGCFFLSNPNQYYTLEIHQSNPAETFNIHFGDHFAEQVFQSINLSPEKMLDDTFKTADAIEFCNRLCLQSPEISAIIAEVHRLKLTGARLEEKLADLVHELLIQERLLQVQSKAIPVVKSSTRSEIHRRLVSATDYIYSYYDRDLSLDELASASCLSKFHFLRLFKIVHQKTPYQFINEVRVQKGKSLLAHSALGVSEISRSVGFKDASSFSRMFFQQTGVYPSTFRGSQPKRN